MGELLVSEYQIGTEKTAIYRDGVADAIKDGGFIENWANLAYCVLGLNGEAGELANNVKKIIRDEGGFVKQDMKDKLFKELGDCHWYLSQIATELGFKTNDILDYNLSKLASRQERGVLQGAGDDR